MGRIDGEEFVAVFLHADAIGVMALAESFCAPRLKPAHDARLVPVAIAAEKSLT
ncbi:hypothetical protein [Delftia sp. PE138]|uniref:hypothetical protein n=1 Tax=Delftia sp. PE138 TaxID=1812483 RepID=UPI001BB0C104|nr:hypothetical protein [Delftia sp. PE138]